VVEDNHMNDYELRSKGYPLDYICTSTPSLAMRNTPVSKSSTRRDASNIEYNIVYDMQKTQASTSL
jgi:hypothetical protein